MSSNLQRIRNCGTSAARIIFPFGLSLVVTLQLLSLQYSFWLPHVDSVGLLNALVSAFEPEVLPRIVWLASFPNSGTSYTMTMVERASNRSIATNYGLEVTGYKNPSIPVHSFHPEGPYYEGNQKHKLPDDYILTKTHCGSRCVRCGAATYVEHNVSSFLDACARTPARLGKNRRTFSFGIA